MGKAEEELCAKFMGYFSDGWPDDLDKPLELMHEDGYYQMNTPMREPHRGKAAIKAEWEHQRDYSCTWVSAEIRNTGSNDRFVYQERIDHAEINGKVISPPLMAVYEVEDGLIVAWREYFDSMAVAKDFGITAEEFYALGPGSTFGQKQ